MKVAYAEGTFKNLRIQWESFLLFCFYYKLNPFPVDVETLCLYAQFLSRSFKSVQSSVRNYLSAVKTLHSLLDLKYPETDLMQLKLLLRGIARSKQHVPRKASPITPHILKDMFSFLDLQQDFDLVCWSIILMMFFLMARISNLLPNSIRSLDPSKQLLRRDIQILDDMIIVHFKWSKTRQFGHSREVPLTAMPGNCLCPVSAYKNMVRKASASQSDPALYIPSGYKHKKLVPVTYPQFQAKFRDLISRTGRDDSTFSPHSLRRGGCTWGFKSSVESELIQHHGDWVSQIYRDYLSYDFKQKLSVSRKMCDQIVNEV